MSSPRLQTRVPEDTKGDVEKYQEENGFPTQSDAVRHLIIEGLDAQLHDDSQPSRDMLGLYLTAVGAGFTVILLTAVTLWLFSSLLPTGALALLAALALLTNGVGALREVGWSGD